LGETERQRERPERTCNQKVVFSIPKEKEREDRGVERRKKEEKEEVDSARASTTTTTTFFLKER